MSQVVVVGSANVDLQAQVAHLPGPGETVLGGALLTSPGGKGANQAVAAHRLGARTRLVCAIGDDVHADAVLGHLTAEGIATDDVHRLRGVATGVALIVVSDDGENTIVVTPGANAELAADHVHALDPAWLTEDSVLVLQLEVPVATGLAAARCAHRSGATVILNCAPMPADRQAVAALLAEVDVLVVNESEARALASGAPGGTVRAWQALATTLRRSGPDTVVVTLGAQGAVAATTTGVLHQPAFAVDPVDTTGAGDVFTAAVATGLADGLGWSHLLRRACAAGALATTASGAQAGAPTSREVERMLALAEEAV